MNTTGITPISRRLQLSLAAGTSWPQRLLRSVRRAALVEFRDMLHTVAVRLQGMLEDGMSTEEIIAAKPTAEFDAKWGGGFLPPDRWVDLVLRGMR